MDQDSTEERLDGLESELIAAGDIATRFANSQEALRVVLGMLRELVRVRAGAALNESAASRKGIGNLWGDNLTKYDAQSIKARIAESATGWESSRALWQDRENMDLIASQLAHALDGSTIDYLTSQAILGHQIEVLVFAGSRIVRARSADYPKFPSTRIFNMAEIKSVELTTVRWLLDEELSEVVTVIVGIADERYTLPANILATSANVAQLGAYLPTLLGRFAPVR